MKQKREIPFPEGSPVTNWHSRYTHIQPGDSLSSASDTDPESSPLSSLGARTGEVLKPNSLLKPDFTLTSLLVYTLLQVDT